MKKLFKTSYIILFVFVVVPNIYGMEQKQENDCCSLASKLITYCLAKNEEDTDDVFLPNRPITPLLPEKIIKWDWQKKCDALDDKDPRSTVLEKEQLESEITLFCTAMNRSCLSDSQTWVKEQPSPAFFDIQNTKTFEPYVQKLEVEPGSEIAFHGDIHGDVHSLNAFIAELTQKGYMDPEDPFRIIKDKFKIILLGDYTDRGKYGAEVIYTILRLKRSNPDEKVVMVRGNHEDVMMNMISSDELSFKNELDVKFNDPSLLMKVQRIYNYLPVALYVLCGKEYKNALLCCHGGIELGFTEAPALYNAPGKIRCIKLGELKRKDATALLPEELTYIRAFPDAVNFIPRTPIIPFGIGFMWYDFNVTNLVTSYNKDRGWECDKVLTDYVRTQQSTQKCKLRGILRAHQHGDLDMMNRIFNHDRQGDDADKGVGKLWLDDTNAHKKNAVWDGMVATFCVCPNTPYSRFDPEFTFDTYGILKTAENFDDWKLFVHRIETKR